MSDNLSITPEMTIFEILMKKGKIAAQTIYNVLCEDREGLRCPSPLLRLDFAARMFGLSEASLNKLIKELNNL